MDGWCQKTDIQVDWLSQDGLVYIDTHPRRMRCENCKRRFMTFVRECDDPGCFHAYFPKHKKPVKKKRKQSRDRGSLGGR